MFNILKAFLIFLLSKVVTVIGLNKKMTNISISNVATSRLFSNAGFGWEVIIYPMALFLVIYLFVYKSKYFLWLFIVANLYIGIEANITFSENHSSDLEKAAFDVALHLPRGSETNVYVITEDDGKKDKYGKIPQFYVPDAGLVLVEYSDDMHINENAYVIASNTNLLDNYNTLYSNEHYTIYVNE